MMNDASAAEKNEIAKFLFSCPRFPNACFSCLKKFIFAIPTVVYCIALRQ